MVTATVESGDFTGTRLTSVLQKNWVRASRVHNERCELDPSMGQKLGSGILILPPPNLFLSSLANLCPLWASVSPSVE